MKKKYSNLVNVVHTDGGSITGDKIRMTVRLWTSIANISGTDRHIDMRKTKLSTAMPLTFNKKDTVNFGPLTIK